MNSEVCHRHSGLETQINTNKDNITELWGKYSEMSDKIGGIMTRLNVVLGGIVVACIMMLLNIVLKSN